MTDTTHGNCATCGKSWFDGEHHESSPPWLYHRFAPEILEQDVAK